MESKRREKEFKALRRQEATVDGFRMKALGLEDRWERKMDNILKLRDVEEFRRGIAKAEIEQRDDRFRDWL